MALLLLFLVSLQLNQSPITTNPLFDLFLFISYVVAYSYVAFLVHQYILKNETKDSQISLFIRFIVRVIWLWFYPIVFMFLFAFSAVFMASSDQGLLFILITMSLILFGMYLIARCSLILPATAIGKPLSFKSSFKATQNHKLTCVCLVILPFISIIFYWLLDLELYVDNLLINLIAEFIDFTFLIFEIVLLSHLYKRVFNKTEGF